MATKTVSGLVAVAREQLRATGALDSMSLTTRMLDSIQRDAFESVLGTKLSALASPVLATVTDAAGQLATSMLGDMAGAVPFIGQAVGLVLSLVGETMAEEAQRAARADAAMRAEAQWRAVVPSGIDGAVPADVFAAYVCATPGMTGGKCDTTTRLRPLLGADLIRLTETPIALDSKGQPYWDQRSAEAMRAGAAKATKRANAGIPWPRRRLYQELRQAIEAQWIPAYASGLSREVLPDGPGTPIPATNTVDGGVSLWPAYLELLAQDADAGRLTAEVCAWYSNHGVYSNGQTFAYQDRPARAEPAWAVIQAARSRLHPHYTQDVAAQKQVEAQVKAALLALRIQSGPHKPWHFPPKKTGRKVAAAVAVATVAAWWLLKG